MKLLTRQTVILILIFCSISLPAQVESVLAVNNFSSFQEWLNQINSIRLENPEKAEKSFQVSYDYFIAQRDTLSAVNTLVEMAINYGHQVEYQLAYDKLWRALFLADQSRNDKAKIPVFIQLGRYYSFYNRQKTALNYLNQALALSKNLSKEDTTRKDLLAGCYYALCSTYNDFNNTLQAQSYLDSCFLFQEKNPKSTNIYYLKFEEACINALEGRNQQSLDSLFIVQPWFEKYSPGFQVLLFTQIGDSYHSLEKLNEAEIYYKKAIAISEEYKSHLDFVPKIYKRLSRNYSIKKEFQNAFTYVQKGNKLDKAFFDSRSDNNRSLLEIKDEFRVEKENQKNLLQEQRISNFEQEERLNFMEYMIFVILIVALFFAAWLYIIHLRRKHRIEKALNKKKRELEKQQIKELREIEIQQAKELREIEIQRANELREIEIQQANELLELKNKELATSSLKLIEKDEVLATLKERLSKGDGDIKAHDLKKIVRSISHSNAQNWEDFEARFISVNKDFYNKLNARYHKLSRGDQKLCALVKLNLSSKEMAKLLGISIESVHTNRYRLRKKLNLTRDVSLTEFIASL